MQNVNLKVKLAALKLLKPFKRTVISLVLPPVLNTVNNLCIHFLKLCPYPPVSKCTYLDWKREKRSLLWLLRDNLSFSFHLSL